MAQIAITRSGGKAAATDLTAGFVAPVSPVTFDNDGLTFVYVKVGATGTTLTPTQQPCSHGRSVSTGLVLAANKDYLLGPFPREEFNDGNGQASFALTSVVTVTIAILRQA
jgi:hypothetical protein